MEINQKGLNNEMLINRADASFTFGSFMLMVCAFAISVLCVMSYSSGDGPSWLLVITLILCASFGIMTPNEPNNMPLLATILAVGITIAGFSAFIWRTLVYFAEKDAYQIGYMFYLVPLFGLLLVAIGAVCALLAEYPDEPDVSIDDSNTLTLSPDLSKRLINQLIDPDENVKAKRDAFLQSVTQINPTDESNKLSFTVNCENNELFKDLVNAVKEEKEKS